MNTGLDEIRSRQIDETKLVFAATLTGLDHTHGMATTGVSTHPGWQLEENSSSRLRQPPATRTALNRGFGKG